MDVNIYALISFAISVITVGVMLFYIIPKQFKEVLRPKDWLTGLRWQILLLFIFSILSAIPSLSYQYLRSKGYPDVSLEVLRNVSTISTKLSGLGMVVLLVLIYNYRNKE